MSTLHGDHAHDGHELAGDHGHHSPYLQHHFETLGQQFESDKFGMWLFLATEVLLFAGLFCAYSVYRANHPDIFIYAHQFLDKRLGGANTIILLFSSLTIAWSVRATQLGQRTLQIAMLVLTLLCACGFLGIKYVEYTTKIKHGLLWGQHYKPHIEHEESAAAGGTEGAATEPGAAASAEGAHAAAPAAAATLDVPANALVPHNPDAEALALPPPAEVAALGGKLTIDPSKIAPASAPPPGLAAAERGSAHETSDIPKNVQTFFAIYFVMTGLHGVHVLAGMIAIFVILMYSIKGIYKPEWYTPVDMVALYWHIVDLVWIFLFPLLYLIH